MRLSSWLFLRFGGAALALAAVSLGLAACAGNKEPSAVSEAAGGTRTPGVENAESGALAQRRVAAAGSGGTAGTVNAAIGGGNASAGAATAATGGTTGATNAANSGGVVPAGAASAASGGAAAAGSTATANGAMSVAGAAGAGASMMPGAAGASTMPVDAGAGAPNASMCSGPIGTLAGELATGIRFVDTQGEPVNAHGGGILREGDTFYLHGEFFSSTTTDNNFNGFSMYSSKDLATWTNEGIILPRQSSGELGPDRKGERPHIIRCPSTGEFVLYAHAASSDYQMDKEVVYATSSTIAGQYAYRGPLKNAAGQIAAHSDMSAYADETGAYVLTEGGHVYTLAEDCHSWLSDKSVPQVNGDSGGSESPTVFRADGTYYWIGSYKTGWRANNNFYSTAKALTGPWTYQGFVAPVSDPKNNLSDERTWLSQSTWVLPVTGCKGTVNVFWGDHWDGNLDTKAPGKHNALATYVFQPLVIEGEKLSMPTYHASWKLDVGAGTWTP